MDTVSSRVLDVVGSLSKIGIRLSGDQLESIVAFLERRERYTVWTGPRGAGKSTACATVVAIMTHFGDIPEIVAATPERCGEIDQLSRQIAVLARLRRPPTATRAHDVFVVDELSHCVEMLKKTLSSGSGEDVTLEGRRMYATTSSAVVTSTDEGAVITGSLAEYVVGSLLGVGTSTTASTSNAFVWKPIDESQ